MFIYICQTPPCFQFTKKINNWDSEKVYLVVCGCLLVICGLQLVVCGRLWSFAGGLWSFLVVCGRLWSFAGVLWSFAVVACYSNYDFQNNFWKRKCIFHCFYTMAKRAFSINLNVNHQKIEIRWLTETSNKKVFFG